MVPKMSTVVASGEKVLLGIPGRRSGCSRRCGSGFGALGIEKMLLEIGWYALGEGGACGSHAAGAWNGALGICGRRRICTEDVSGDGGEKVLLRMVPIKPGRVGGSRDKAEEEEVVCSRKCCYCTVNVSQPMQCEAGAKASGDGREGSMGVSVVVWCNRERRKVQLLLLPGEAPANKYFQLRLRLPRRWTPTFAATTTSLFSRPTKTSG